VPDFRLQAPFEPTGDQPQAIGRLAGGIERGLKRQVLLGATGTGKTFTISQVIERANKPTLVLAHNKTLAAQLYSEFREFFPDNAVEYFVSYFDYYQPEAYLPRSDTYIEKDSSRNDEIDKLRHAATRALFERRDVIIVASVSCIYGLGAPVDYGATVVRLRRGGRYRRDGVLRQLVDLQYQRNDQALSRAKFRVRGDTLELQPAYDDFIVRVEFFGDEVERVTELDPLTGELIAERNELNVYPASHYVTPAEKMAAAIADIEAELEERVPALEARGMVLEAERLRQRTTFDLEMMRELGFCSGIENYSRHLARREPGSRPWTLLDYFPPDWLLVVDESHMTIPQVVGMYKNDRTRKEILVDFGFRLPSALDNRPLTFEEFEEHLDRVVYMSATPGAYELGQAQQVVEQLIRPTGIVDPRIEVRPTEGQIDDLIDRVRERVDRGERVLVTTLTKKMAEDLADYLHEMGVRVSYLHSEVDTLERVQILRDLRLGVYDVLVGINLLREGIDLPEVTLVAILDADKEGFLRSAWSLIQVVGRAARNVGGEVVMYADRVTESMQVAIEETNRRRAVQEAWNREQGITPTTIVKEIRDINDRLRAVAEAPGAYGPGGRELTEMSQAQVEKLVKQLEAEMRNAAKQLEFERAAAIRDEIQDIRIRVLEQDASLAVLKAAERAARADGDGSGVAAGGGTGRGAAARRGPGESRGGPADASAPPSKRQAAMKAGDRRARREGAAAGSSLEVTEVTVLPAGEEPLSATGAHGGRDHGREDDTGHDAVVDEGTAADLFPGLKDSHEDLDEGWMARWLDRPTWDRRVTPNVIKRTGTRPPRRR
jgi:excinuclease ABC subunit B